MRVIAILASVIIGAAIGAVVGALVDMATGTVGTISAIGLVVGAVGLPIWVARLVPRSPAAQRRHDQAMGRQYPNRLIRKS